jgi:ABC-type amino acid transport substrate-binding protein
MKKFTIISVIIALCALYYFYYQNPTPPVSNRSTKNILLVGTSADYPPYEKIDLATGEIVGFDIDVIKEIGLRINKEITFKDMPFNSLMVNLAAGQVDLVVAGLSATEDRKETVLFGNIYLDSDYMVIVTPTTTPPLTNVTDLYGKTVAVNTGYNADKYLSTMPEISLVRLDSAADSALALQANSVDAFATSKSSYNIFVEQQGKTGAYQYFMIPNTADHCAFAYQKTNYTLKAEIDAALKEIIEDGTLQKIKTIWGFND